jgi:hypothetical protein
VTTRNGAVFDAHVDRPLGRDLAHPLPPGVLQQKFRDCAGMILTPESTAAVEAAMLAIEDCPNLREIGHLLRTGARPRPRLGAHAPEPLHTSRSET